MRGARVGTVPPPGRRAGAVPGGRRRRHDRRAGAGFGRRGAAPAGRRPLRRAPAQDRRAHRRRVRDRGAGRRRVGAAGARRRAAGVRRSDRPGVPDRRRPSRRDGHLRTAGEDRRARRGAGQVHLRHPPWGRGRPGRGGAPRGPGGRPPAGCGVSFPGAGGTGPLHRDATELMPLLDSIRGPEDVKRLPAEQLPVLAAEVRQRLIDVVSQTGGHIGAGLGVVELTIALLHVFDSPRDRIVWDVGHHGYPWKILTGRNAELPTLRQRGGLSGFLRRTESPHDHFGAGHAGTGLSAALGMATARDLKGEDFKVVAVVGEGALTCGLPYEAMNNAGPSGRDIIMVLNDNGMSIAPNVGAINRYLGSIIASPITVPIREKLKHLIEAASHVVGGPKLVDFAKTVEESIKNLWSPGMLFEELGFRYFGPIDGHDIDQMVQTFELVKTLKGPRVVHVITEKGKGFPLPEPDLEKYHARAPYDPVTGQLKPAHPGPPQWTKIFGET